MTVSDTPATASQAVEMRVVDVRKTTSAKGAAEDRAERHFVILEEVNGTRTFLFWVGAFEGHSVTMLLENVQTSRPLTYAFLANVLEAAGGRLKEARITRLADETFYAVAVVESAAGIREVDARPSDAVTLALLTGAPILVEADLLATVERGVPPRDMPVGDMREKVYEESIGAADIAAEIQERWLKAGWKPKE